MHQQQPAEYPGRQHAQSAAYPLGRGYGHDYMRGGEVFGGYGYSERAEYERRRGEASGTDAEVAERLVGTDAGAVS